MLIDLSLFDFQTKLGHSGPIRFKIIFTQLQCKPVISNLIEIRLGGGHIILRLPDLTSNVCLNIFYSCSYNVKPNGVQGELNIKVGKRII